MAENPLGELNSTLMNLAGMMLAVKQFKRQKEMGNLEAMLGLGKQMGITPEMYTGIQETAKKAGINFPDVSAFKSQGSPVSKSQAPEQDGIMQMLAGLSQSPGSPLQPNAPNTAVNLPQGLSPEEQQILGPPKKYQDFADEVSMEMGINPDNLIGGEPLKKYRQESSIRYRQYLKDRESQVKGLMMETAREKRQLKVEDKRWEERWKMEDKKEESRREFQLESERIGDERQAAALAASERKLEKSLSASEKRMYKTLDAAEKRAYIRERGDDRRLEKREGYIEERFERRLKEEGKKKLITIYNVDGRTKMVPIPVDQEYEPPAGWTIGEPSKEEKALRILRDAPPPPAKKPSKFKRFMKEGLSFKKTPVYDINGKLLRYE